MAEAVSMYRGKIDEYRFIRQGFNLIHCSLVGKDRADMLEVLPLPFDSELAGMAQDEQEQMIQQYYLLQQQGVFNA